MEAIEFVAFVVCPAGILFFLAWGVWEEFLRKGKEVKK